MHDYYLSFNLYLIDDYRLYVLFLFKDVFWKQC
jgi:hypothetical protein